MTDLLEVRGLTVVLPTAAGWVRPVNEVSRRIGAGESLGLVGESGSGKTMTALALMGLLPPTRMVVLFTGSLVWTHITDPDLLARRKEKPPKTARGLFPPQGC